MITIFAFVAIVDAGAVAARALQWSQAPRRGGVSEPRPQPLEGRAS